MKIFQRGIGVAVLALAAGMAPTAYAADSCGRISVFDVAPRNQQLYRAVLIAVDGRLPGPTDSPSYRVTPGRHVLRVAEAIDAHQFSAVNQYKRDRRGRERYEEIEVDVQPGTTYRLAAKFNLDRRHEIRDGGYWDPVIWKEDTERCR
jgi:hypothetical protein